MMAQDLAATLEAYVDQLRSQGTPPDGGLLQQARRILGARLRQEGMTAEVVRLGERFYRLTGEWDACIALLTRYLEQPLATEEEAWARWHRTDFLAMQRRYAEAVTAQKEFFAWASARLPPDRLLWVMSDGTQALAWQELGLRDEWLTIFAHVTARVTPTAGNRLDRFYYLRTAGHLLINFGHTKEHIRADEALGLAGRMRDLAKEDRTWDRAFDILMQSYVLELGVHQARGDTVPARRLGLAATAALEDRLRGAATATADERERLAVLYDNTASALYQARRYDLAIPLFQRSIALGSPAPHARIWLAASLWATARDRAAALDLLHEAALRWYSPRRPWDYICGLPEFQDVADDAEFEQAAARPA
jgi:tetratricopeptide (TPR) repeat protein